MGEDRQIGFEQAPVAKGEPLKLQFDAFLDCVETRNSPKCSGRCRASNSGVLLWRFLIRLKSTRKSSRSPWKLDGNRSPPPADAELTSIDGMERAGRRRAHANALVGSVLAHVAIIGILMAVPLNLVEPEAAGDQSRHHLEPVTELTQKAPNTGKITKEFESPMETRRATIQVPAGPFAPPRRAAASRPGYSPGARA